MIGNHVHDWQLPPGDYRTAGTNRLPYRCDCGAFTHDPDTGKPCPICDPHDFAQRHQTPGL